jgi:hypothetical protein
MSLSPHEERKAAEIAEDLRAHDAAWSRLVDELSDELGGRDERTVPRVHPPFVVAIACLASGLLVLFASRYAWVRVKLALASGLPAASVRTALVVTACTAALAAALFLARAAQVRRVNRELAARDREPAPLSR